MIKMIKKLLKCENSQTLEEIYLAQSASLEDLERRQKQINRGQAPWHNAKVEW